MSSTNDYCIRAGKNGWMITNNQVLALDATHGILVASGLTCKAFLRRSPTAMTRYVYIHDRNILPPFRSRKDGTDLSKLGCI
jgi:hypothetical protein